MVTLIEKPKKGKDKQREFKADQKLAEKMLRKSRSWTLPENSPYVFKDGALVPKAKNAKTEKKADTKGDK